MGPVVDPRHDDLLNNWDDVDAALRPAMRDGYRMRHADDVGRGTVFSFSCVSWSGFDSNPVERDFGYHTIFDHYRDHFGEELERWGDTLYWMYNHPAPSKVGNEWGLDWYDNAQYLDILNHFILDRAFFPNAVQVPTETNDCSYMIEQWLPFDIGNRNSLFNVLDSINQDGKKTSDVFDWRKAPYDWSHYRPSREDYRLPGDMRHHVFRIVDIKSIINVMRPEDLRQAFFKALRGEDVMVCGYEHDFRDRYETIQELYLGPLFEMRQREFPDVPLRNATVQEAARAVTGRSDSPAPQLSISPFAEGFLIRWDRRLFGAGPYVCTLEHDNGRYRHWPVSQIGETGWFLPVPPVQGRTWLGVAAHDENGSTTVWRGESATGDLAQLQPLSEKKVPSPNVR